MVLHVRVVCGRGGGPDKTILHSPRYLEEQGFDSLCAYMRPPRDTGFAHIEEQAAALDAPLVAVDDRGPWDASVVWQLLRVCRENRATIWHGHDYKSNAVGLLLRKFWPMHLVTTVHGWVKFTRRTPVYYGLDRFCLRHYERVICVSDELEQRCIAAGVPAGRCLHIANAIDPDAYRRRQSPAEAKRALGLPDRLLVGAVGRLSAEKGFDLLIRAVGRLAANGRDVGLVILGEGDEQAGLGAMIRELNLEDRVRLVGHQADVRPWMEAMDVFALSSIREGLPNALLEAMALGVPSVAARVAGVPEVVHDGQNGLTIETGSEDALVASLRRLLADAPLRSRLAAAARETIERDHSFRRRMQRVCQVYEEVLGRTASVGEQAVGAGRQV